MMSYPSQRASWRSRALPLLILLQGMRDGSAVPADQVDFALDLLSGKVSADQASPPVPWSTEALRQLEKYTWDHWYSEDTRYRNKNRKTPIEIAVERVFNGN